METFVTNACMPLPAPVPDNVVVEHPHTSDGAVEVDANKIDASVRIANSVSVKDLGRGNNQENAEKDEDPKLSKSKAPFLVPGTEVVSRIEISEKAEYDDNNPKIITKCKHHFHFACILEWVERSDICPVCNNASSAEMTFSSLTNQ